MPPRLWIAVLTFAAGLVVAGFAKTTEDCQAAQPFYGQLGFRTPDGGSVGLGELSNGAAWEQVKFDGRVYYVMADGGWSFVRVSHSGHPHFVPIPSESRTFALSDGGHLTELTLEDGGSVCFPLEEVDVRPTTIPKAHQYILLDAPQVTEWFASERKSAQRASECHVPAGKVSDCRELDADILALHKVYMDYFTAFCSQGGQSPTQAGAQLGIPDDDVAKTCASGPCRFWSWKWNATGQGGIFSVEFGLPQHSHGTDWMLVQCNYCTKAGCIEMPQTMP